MSGPGAAVILAGGRASRLGGVDKPGLTVAGRSLLDAVLDAVLAAVRPARTVVVGPDRSLPAGVRQTREEPAFGGPAAALAAGLALLAPAPDELVAVLAADLPGITGGTLADLCAARETAGRPGALAVDSLGRPQFLLGVWVAAPLLAAVAARASWRHRPVRELFGPLGAVEVPLAGTQIADIDSPADLARWNSGAEPAESAERPESAG